MPRTRTRSLAAALALSAATFACGTGLTPPPKGVLESARGVTSYSGALRVSLRGSAVRARARALVAFERPDRMRIEVPGPDGLRLLAVARDGRLTAAFPADRAVFAGEASAASLEALLGVRLTPAEVMDLLLGAQPPRVRSYKTRWGSALPESIVAVLEDGTRLGVDVGEAEAGRPVPAAAFDEPPHEGYRTVDADEARRLWSAR